MTNRRNGGPLAPKRRKIQDGRADADPRAGIVTVRGRRDIVVPCAGGGHKVRLKGGARFLARARCPKCRSAVDPTRRRRLLGLVANLRRPASDDARDVTLWRLSGASVVYAAVVAALFWWLTDRWWLATLVLFGPRWVLMVPIVVLMVLAAAKDRALLVPLGVSAWLILGPVMGFQTGWRALLTFGDDDRDVTVASFNALGGDVLPVGPHDLMMEWGADVAVFQECGPRLQEEIAALAGWHTWRGRNLCLVSRFPLVDTRVMETDVLQGLGGGSGQVVTHLLQPEQGSFLLTNVHLETPRGGLALIRSGSPLEGARVLKENSSVREVEHDRAARFTTGPGPHIVAGDFNTPPESRIYRAEWGEWTNAFSVAGFGLGGTRLNGWIRARIDHVLVNDSWRVVDAWLGRDLGSDHLPVLARVRRRR